MKTLHKQHRLKHNKIARIFRSWWCGVAILLLLVISLALYQKHIKTKHQNNVTHNTANITQNQIYGIALSDMLYDTNNTTRAAVLTKIKRAGFKEVRLSTSWRRVEATQGQYNWIHFDGMMQAVKKSGLKMILLTDSTPTWARQDVCKASAFCPPQDPSNYANFVSAAANRYKYYDVAGWEIWNEQNGSNFWKPQPSPEQYAELLKLSYVAIKKVNPKATVLIGGLSGDSIDNKPSLIDPRTYLTQLYAAGIHGYFDGLAYHPYFGVALSMTKPGDHNGWAKMDTTAINIRSIMVAHGDADKDIWITEFGVPTGGSGAVITNPSIVPTKADHFTLEAQAQVAQAVVDSVSHYPWIHSFIWYSYEDDTLAKTYSGAAYGIWQQDGTPKPILKVLQNAMQTSSDGN